MHLLYKGMIRSVLSALLVFAVSVAFAQQPGASTGIMVPVVQLQHWKNSTTQERQAFLAGFLSMLEVEYIWQGKAGLPVSQSTVPTWRRGLIGVTIPEIDQALNEYIAANPQKGDRTVMEALGRIFVRPKLTEQERQDAGKRYDVLKKAGFVRR